MTNKFLDSSFVSRLVETAWNKNAIETDEEVEHMSPSQKAKKEKIVLSMKGKEKEFKAKYGDRWEKVMHATATKLAMKEDFNVDDLEESVDVKKKTTDTLAGRVEGGHENDHLPIKIKLKAESVDRLDELNKDTLYSYKKKADRDYEKQSDTLDKAIDRNDDAAANKAGHKIQRRVFGSDRADTRLTKESTLARYRRIVNESPVELQETAMLDEYIRSRGYNPDTMPKDKKVAFSKTKEFILWSKTQALK
jgi:hypothetical protein